MSRLDALADSENSGSSLRNEAAKDLAAIHGNSEIEQRVNGKKIDIVVRTRDCGRDVTLFVESKDYKSRLTRKFVSEIIADYLEILKKTPGSRLLILTRNGMATDAEELIHEHSELRHQTIWDLEDEVLGLGSYIRAQKDSFLSEGLSSYYVASRAREAFYDQQDRRQTSSQSVDLFSTIQNWVNDSNPPPIAILGGYGAGKTSFARRLISHQADLALSDPTARRPILIKLGNVTRTSSLDGLLGALFTSEFEVRGYSYHRFMEFNRNGRFLVVLDGFDEMKHAMSWNDFRNEIRSLNELNQGDSRVLLLGRPSAFTSDDEHLEVLRGRRRTDVGTRRLADWPEFREFDLEPFSGPERTAFVSGYIRHRTLNSDNHSGDSIKSDAIDKRIKEVNSIADRDADVFGKPVHAKILVELAMDPTVDLSNLLQDITRWTLYSEFFSSLARREASKAARAPISEHDRLKFLRHISVWLWQSRDGATAFKAADLPPELLADLPSGDADGLDEKRREYLTGAFLERKSGDTYYFAHRSFAEFLVAQSLALELPTEQTHSKYDTLVRDGVQEFLEESVRQSKIGEWPLSFANAIGEISMEYIAFLTKHAGGYEPFLQLIPEKSAWINVVRLLNEPQRLDENFGKSLWTAFRYGTAEANAMAIYAIGALDIFAGQISNGGAEPASVLIYATPYIAAALIDRVLSQVREESPMARLTIDAGDTEQQLRLIRIGASLKFTVGQDRQIMFSWPSAVTAADDILSRAGRRVKSRSPLREGFTPHSLIVNNLDAISRLLSKQTRPYFSELAKRNDFLSAISVVSAQRVRRPG